MKKTTVEVKNLRSMIQKSKEKLELLLETDGKLYAKQIVELYDDITLMEIEVLKLRNDDVKSVFSKWI